MKLNFRTEVAGHYLAVMERFDRNLFEALAPPVGNMEIVKFTGSRKGDIVHIRFLSPIKGEWISEIIDHGDDEHLAYFIDEGVKLPFGIKKWKHRHIVEHINENSCAIIDDIEYTGVNKLWTWLMFPGLYAGFAPRSKVYQKYFGKA